MFKLLLQMPLFENHTIDDPMSVKWLESYSNHINIIWMKLPRWVSSIFVSLSVFLFGVSLRGEWIHAVVHCLHYLGLRNPARAENNHTLTWINMSMESLYLKNLFWYWMPSLIIGFAVYFTIGGFLHWYFYVRQRTEPEKWKCQPHKWLSPELEAHEICMGSMSLVVASTASSIIACYIDNGGPSSMYRRIDEYSWTWFFLQWPVIFLYQDYVTYWLHRTYHTPFLYKHFHKLHHKYVQPTAFSVTAIHPVEILHIQMTTQLPFMLLIPVHFSAFYCILFYTFYNGIIDHSGIDFKAPWWQPWRPDTIFHDNHHQYFHVNFSFNCFFWDIIHGTYRRTDRIYKEDIFYGHGKPLEKASVEELKAEVEERLSENKKAHRKHNYILTSAVLQKDK